MVRLFFAVEPSIEVREAVCEAGRVLQESSARLSVVQSNLMHITLKFLGEVPLAHVPKIISVAENLEGFAYEMKISRVSSFGKPPRVVKAEIFDGGHSALLAKSLDELLLPLGFLKDEKKFSPHITIVRVKNFSPDLLEKISDVAGCEFGNCVIDSVQLKKSTLTPKGPVYETLFEKKME